MRYEQGQSGNPNGRQKGIPNKLTQSTREVIQMAFDGIGGVDALMGWAIENKTEFYKIYSKLLPQDVSLNATITITQPKLALSHEAGIVIDQFEDEPADLLLTSETA